MCSRHACLHTIKGKRSGLLHETHFAGHTLVEMASLLDKLLVKWEAHRTLIVDVSLIYDGAIEAGSSLLHLFCEWLPRRVKVQV